MFDTVDSDERQILPVGLDRMEPGVTLGVILANVDATRLSGHDRVVVLRARQRMASHLQAQIYADMAAVADAVAQEDDDLEFATEAAAGEIRVALRLTRRAADSELGFALELVDRLPAVWAAMASGDLDWRRARVLVHGTSHLDAEVAAAVVDRVIDDAPGLTTGQLAARLRRLCIDTDPEDAATRFKDAVDQRRVVMEPTVDGTANLLGMDLSPERVSAVTRHINEVAKSLSCPGEERTMDQLRADVFLDLLEGRHVSGRGKGTVDIRVDLDTLARLAEHPGELAGYGPVIADIARQVTETQTDSRWRFAVTDPGSGQVVDTGVIRRRPTAGQRRHVEVRSPTCVFPGCRMPSTGCDFDHVRPWSEGGATTTGNGAPACRHDHVFRHRAGWTYQRLADGDYQWTTKLGHTYMTSGRSP